MNTSPDEFADLLARARQGDAEALRLLAERYEPQVRQAARGMLGPALRPHLDSLDLVQSVHRSLLVALREERFEFDGPKNLIALAVTMVRRKVARLWRRARRQKRAGTGSDSNDQPGLLASLDSPEAGPDREAELRDSVEHLCASLDETERRMLEMQARGDSTAEIARALGLNEVALRVRLCRLRQRLREGSELADLS